MADSKPAAPTTQGDLFRPMCGRNVAAQRDLFAADVEGEQSAAKKAALRKSGQEALSRVPDLPGQQTFV